MSEKATLTRLLKQAQRITGREDDFSGGPVVQNASSNTGDLGLIPGWGANIPRTAEAQLEGF